MRDAPDAGWLPFLKVVLGYLLVLAVSCLALAIGLGKVEEKTSFGLQYILGALSVLVGGFSQWCFSGASHKTEAPNANKPVD